MIRLFPLLLLFSFGTALAQQNNIIEIIKERPLAPGEFSEDEISQALCWRFGIPPPIVELDEKQLKLYRQPFDQLGAATFRERDAAERELVGLMPQPRIILNWAKASEDPEVRMRALDVVRGWRGKLTEAPRGVSTKKLEPIDVLSRLPSGPFMIRAMNAMQAKDAQMSNEFYRKQVRVYAYGLDRDERLECIRLTNRKLEGSTYAPASRSLLTLPYKAEEMRDPEWLLEIAKIHSTREALSDYRSLQFLEHAFRGAPADMDLKPFEPLLGAENPNRHMLGGVLGRLGHEEGAKLFLTGLKDNQNMQRYAYMFNDGMRPEKFPDPKAAEAVFAEVFKMQSEDLKKRYSSSPEYMASQFSRILGPVIDVPGVQDELRKLAADKKSPIRLQAALALRKNGQADRELLKNIDIEDGQISTYLYNVSSTYGTTFHSTHAIKTLIAEILSEPDKRAKAEEDLRHVFRLQAAVMKDDMKRSREKGRPSASTVKRNIEAFCGNYAAYVLPLGIDADLREDLLGFGSYLHAKRDSYSEIPMRTALHEAIVTGTQDELVEQVLAGTNAMDALYLLAMADPTFERSEKLFQLKKDEFADLKPMPPPVREALQLIDPVEMHKAKVKYTGTIPVLTAENLERLGLKSLPEAWLEGMDPNTAKLIRFCQDRTAELPDKPLVIDKDHIEPVLSLARTGDAPPALIERAMEGIPQWILNTKSYATPSTWDLHRMSLIAAASGTDMTPTHEHPSVRAYGWNMEARRRMALGDAAGAVAAWDELKPLMASTRAYSTSSTRAWLEEEWIARWLAGEDREELKKKFEAHTLTSSYAGYEILRFLIHDGEHETAHAFVDMIQSNSKGNGLGSSWLLLTWSAAESGNMELAKTYAADGLHSSGSADSLRIALLLQDWIERQPEGFAAYATLSADPERTAADYQALLETTKEPELRALVAWRGAGEAWKAEDETARRKLLDAAAALPDTLYGAWAKIERDARSPEEAQTMIVPDGLTRTPFPRRIHADFSRLGLVKKPDAEPVVFERVIFLDERGLPLISRGVSPVNTGWGLWLAQISTPDRYRSGLRRVLAKGMNGKNSEAHGLEVLPWRSLLTLPAGVGTPSSRRHKRGLKHGPAGRQAYNHLHRGRR